MFAAHVLRTQLLESAGKAGGSLLKTAFAFKQWQPPVASFASRRPFAGGVIKQAEREVPKRTQSRPGFWGPAAFVCATSAGAFAYAIAQDEKLRSTYASRHLQSLRELVVPPRAPDWLPAPLDRWWLQLRRDWNDLSPCEKLAWGLVAANFGVFLMWQIRVLKPFMYNNFLQTLPPQHTRVWTLLTCNFSHISALHFGVNMYGAFAFVKPVCALLGAPQAAALYMAGGMCSSLASHVGALLGRGGATGSLGASGAIYACAAAVAALMPDVKASLIFLPWFPLPLSDLFLLVVGFDFLGVVLRWRTFDHWGHLGGALFGWLYAKYGRQIIWPGRQVVEGGYPGG